MDMLKKLLKKFGLYDITVSTKENLNNLFRRGKRKEFYSNFIEENYLCFDVGANIGNRTEVFLSLGAKVVCVEPQKSCFEILKKKFGNNENAKLVNKALGKKEGKGEIFTGDSSTLASMSKDWISKVEKTGRFGDETWNKSQSVLITTLDKLITEYGLPDFCKIDVEGFEYEVLSGLSKPIKVLSFEFASESINSAKECVQLLSKIGEYTFNYSSWESMEFALDKWVKGSEILEILRDSEDRNIWGDIYAKLN